MLLAWKYFGSVTEAYISQRQGNLIKHIIISLLTREKVCASSEKEVLCKINPDVMLVLFTQASLPLNVRNGT